MIKSRLEQVRAMIEKLAQLQPPFVPGQKSGPTQHAILHRPVSSPASVGLTQKAPTINNISDMQSRILDLAAILKDLKMEIPAIGKNNVPDGGWGLKTNASLQKIGDYLASVYPLLKELKREGMMMDEPNQGALDWFRGHVPHPTKNVIPLTQSEKQDLAGEMVKALKYFGGLVNQFKSLAQQGKFRGLLNGSEDVASFPSKNPLITAKDPRSGEDEIANLTRNILERNPDASLNVGNVGGKNLSVPLKALTDPEVFKIFMKEHGNLKDDAEVKSVFNSNVLPAARNLGA